MTVRASGTNARLRKEEIKAIAIKKEIKTQLIKEGFSEAEAEIEALKKLRDNSKGDWRNA